MKKINDINTYKLIIEYINLDELEKNYYFIYDLIKQCNISIIKFIFTKYNINLNNFNKSLVIESYKYNNKEIIDFLIERSIHDKVIYYDNDNNFLREKGILLDYLFNYNAKLNITTNINKLNIERYTKYLYNLIYTKCSNILKIDFLNNELQSFSLKCIVFKFDDKNEKDIKSIKLIIQNNNMIDFIKENNKYVLELIDKISLYHLKLDSLKLLIEFNDKCILNDIDIYFNLINDFSVRKIKYKSYTIKFSENEIYECNNNLLTKC